MKEKDIVMGVKEAKRLRVIEETIEKQMTQQKAASILGLSERQIRRMVKRVTREGPAGIIHRKSSARKIPEAIKTKVINLYQERYPDFGPTLFQEKLLEKDGIKIGKETLRTWLIKEGLL